MIRKQLQLFTLIVLSLTEIVGCGKNRSSGVQVPHEGFMEDLQPEISKNKIVDKLTHQALEVSTDTKAVAWREFISHWPSARQNIGIVWSKQLQKFQVGLDAITIIESRYTLKIILDCELNSDYKNVAFTKLRFNLEEVKEVGNPPEGPQEGGVTVKFKASSNRWFGEKEWGQLKQANWDFGSIGINVVSNAPIPNIRWVLQ